MDRSSSLASDDATRGEHRLAAGPLPTGLANGSSCARALFEGRGHGWAPTLARGRSGPSLLDELRHWLDVLRDVAGTKRRGSAGCLLEYAFQVGVLPEDLRRLSLQIGPAAEEAYLTAAQKLTEESYARGRAAGIAELLVRQLGLRFGSLPEATRQKIRLATPERLDVWAERVITRRSLEEILGSPSPTAHAQCTLLRSKTQ